MQANYNYKYNVIWATERKDINNSSSFFLNLGCPIVAEIKRCIFVCALSDCIVFLFRRQNEKNVNTTDIVEDFESKSTFPYSLLFYL